MKIDISIYDKAKDDFIANLHRKEITKWKDLSDNISLYCACVGLPIFVALTFAEAEYPQFAEKLKQNKQSITEFYGYEK